MWEFRVHFFRSARTKGAGSHQIWQVSETKNSDRGVTGHTPVQIIRNSTVIDLGLTSLNLFVINNLLFPIKLFLVVASHHLEFPLLRLGQLQYTPIAPL